ncbi:hypothetical protein GSI_08389 [Ganoderma sinense ZZ0214-1]|uniref:Uncharacterized protein n=1 Tax=Ganoderma sinense ZZ0214-1 TaxID=1077348 RepID=A0A2G8S6U4_9APHY|nr:hypothetical protein GSI_08389 [Ganoderma sinense ZZ0214-1]
MSQQLVMRQRSRLPVHDGVLAAMTLALCVIMDCPRVTRTNILVPDRAAATTLTSRPDHPLVRLFLARLPTITRCSRSSLRVRIVWAPLRGEDRKVLLKRYDEQLHSEWKVAWESSRQGHHIGRVVDDTPPGPAVLLKLYRGLSRRQCSILSQLRSGHVGLNAYLAQIRAIDSPLCLTCAIPETVSHFPVFTCRRFTAVRHSFRTAVEGPMTLKNTISNVKTRAAVLDFVDGTSRFEAYRTPPQ